MQLRCGAFDHKNVLSEMTKVRFMFESDKGISSARHIIYLL